MSVVPQQINLLNPELRERRDWLRLPLLAILCGLVVVGEGGAYGYYAYQRQQLAASDGALEQELKKLQANVKALESTVSGRKPNPALMQELETARAALIPREAALDKLKQATSEGFSESLRGLSRQTSGGVWLTEFALRGQDLTLRGRLLDPVLLPSYIARLNAEPAFRGRQFASLEMKSVVPDDSKQPGDKKPLATAEKGSPSGKTAVAPTQPFTEFSLLGVLPAISQAPQASPQIAAPGLSKGGQ